ncbi:MAG: ammonium transporter [Puniceicoccales bacterium]|nr:ammonium transporter [Puniceicoccales bacterium]
MSFKLLKTTFTAILLGLACSAAAPMSAQDATGGQSVPAALETTKPAAKENQTPATVAPAEKTGEAAKPIPIDSGNTAWMLTSTALVLFMTLPGLALFYGGLVRKKNVLSVLAQCLGIAGLATILWWAVGFSLSFGTGGQFIGDTSIFFLKGISGKAGFASGTLPGVPQSVWVVFQLTFAIITPALIIGAIAERMKFTAVILFVALWSVIVYYPMAHMVWGGGFMSGADGTIHAIDFAGGAVVHMSSGYSALILALILGPRLGFRKEKMSPHSMVLCMVGTAILWIGWYGFNAGSAGAADGLAGNAFLTTTFAAAIGGFTWALLEFITKKQPSVLGFCSGIVAGLVVITPAAGFVDATGAVICGVAAGVIPFFACMKLKAWLGYDDALDTFGVHAVGGTVGTVLTGILAIPEINDVGANAIAASTGLTWDSDKAVFLKAVGEKLEVVAAPGNGALTLEQIKATLFTVVLSVVATAIIAFIIKFTIGLRPSADVESSGLDINEHGEEGYGD